MVEKYRTQPSRMSLARVSLIVANRAGKAKSARVHVNESSYAEQLKNISRFSG